MLQPLVFAGLWLLGPAVAHAHIEITSHQSRHGPDYQKRGPCGVEGSPRGEVVYTYRHGQTVTVEWYEFVDHPGHYRIAFDDDGDDDFVDPISPEDRLTNATVLLDGIEDLPGVHHYAVDVELPDIECETCTLQVVQVMTDKPPYGDGNDLYYHCLDLRLVGDNEELPEPNLPGGCQLATSPTAPTSPGAVLLVVGVALGLRRRNNQLRNLRR